MTDVRKDVTLVKEWEVRVTCRLHGGDGITYRPRENNLGHGRAFIDLANAYCRSCGSSVWLTISVSPMKSERISVEDFQAALLAVLNDEMGPAIAETEDKEDEVVPVRSDTGEQAEQPHKHQEGELSRRRSLG